MKGNSYVTIFYAMARQIRFNFVSPSFRDSKYIHVGLKAPYIEGLYKSGEPGFMRTEPFEGEPRYFSADELEKGQWYFHTNGTEIRFNFTIRPTGDHLLYVFLETPHPNGQDLNEEDLKEGQWYLRLAPQL